jgi:hypothetical protein
MSAEIVECTHEPQARGTMFAVALERIEVTLLGSGEMPGLPEEVTEIGVVLGAARLEGDAFSHQLFGVRNAPCCLADQPKEVQGGGAARCPRQHPATHGLGLRQVAPAKQLVSRAQF